MTIAVRINLADEEQILCLVDMDYMPGMNEVLYTPRLQGNLYKGIEIGPRASLRDALAHATTFIYKAKEMAKNG